MCNCIAFQCLDSLYASWQFVDFWLKAFLELISLKSALLILELVCQFWLRWLRWIHNVIQKYYPKNIWNIKEVRYFIFWLWKVTRIALPWATSMRLSMSANFHAMFVCLTDIIFWFWKAHNDTKLVSYILKSKQLVHKWTTNCIVLSLRLLITRPKFTINVEKQLLEWMIASCAVCTLLEMGNTTTCCERDRAGHVHMNTWCN